MDVSIPVGSFLTPSFERATAADAMRRWVLTCSPETPLITAAQRMASEHVHALVILHRAPDRDLRRPVAVLTDLDLVRNARALSELTAADAATGEALTTTPDEPLAGLADRMLAHGTSHAIVLDPDTGHPAGVVSTLDIAGILGWGRA